MTFIGASTRIIRVSSISLSDHPCVRASVRQCVSESVLQSVGSAGIPVVHPVFFRRVGTAGLPGCKRWLHCRSPVVPTSGPGRQDTSIVQLCAKWAHSPPSLIPPCSCVTKCLTGGAVTPALPMRCVGGRRNCRERAGCGRNGKLCRTACRCHANSVGCDFVLEGAETRSTGWSQELPASHARKTDAVFWVVSQCKAPLPTAQEADFFVPRGGRACSAVATFGPAHRCE